MRSAPLSLSLALLAAPGVVAAQSPAPAGGNAQLAQSHFQTGLAEYRAGHLHEAAAEFRAAYEQSHEPALLYNLGSVYFDEGDLADARDAYTQFLAARPNAPNRPLLEARIASINARLAAAPTTTSASSPEPAHATTAAAAPTSHEPASAAPATATANPPPSHASDDEGGRSMLSYVGLGAAALGLVALGVGVGLYADADGQFHTCQASPIGCTQDMQRRTEDYASVAMMWGGGVIAVAGAALFLFAPRTHAREHARGPSIHFAFDPRGAIAIGGTF